MPDSTWTPCVIRYRFTGSAGHTNQEGGFWMA